MIEARDVSSFQYILCPTFGGNSASVLNFLTNPKNWEELYGKGSFQYLFSDHAAPSHIQFTSATKCLLEPEARELASPCLQLYFAFM